MGFVEYPRQSSAIHLESYNLGNTEYSLYAPLLAYLRIVWQDQVRLVPETAPAHLGEPLIATCVTTFA